MYVNIRIDIVKKLDFEIVNRIILIVDVWLFMIYYCFFIVYSYMIVFVVF